MSDEQMARAAHEVIRAYQAAIGEEPSPPWEEMPEDVRAASVRTAALIARPHVAQPAMTPERLHDRWCDDRLSSGWVWGPAKDPALKTHPCLVGWDDLSDEQRAKDSLFLHAVLGAHAVASRYCDSPSTPLTELIEGCEKLIEEDYNPEFGHASWDTYLEVARRLAEAGY